MSEIFDDCKNEMMKDAMSKKASKKLKAMAPKLNLLPNDVKQQMLSLYLYRQNLRHSFYAMDFTWRKSFA